MRHAEPLGALDQQSVIARRAPAQRIVDLGERGRCTLGRDGEAAGIGQDLGKRARGPLARRIARSPAPFLRKAGAQRGICAGAIRHRAALSDPAPAEIARHQPVAALGARDDVLLGDAEPVMELVGEGQRGGGAVGQRPGIGRQAEHDHLGCRQSALESDCGEHANLSGSRDDDAL